MAIVQTAKTNEEIIAGVLTREGGFVNDPADPGGATNYGITLASLQAYRHQPVTVADVQALTMREAATIYLQKYVFDPGFHLIGDWDLRNLLVDCAVNHGTQHSIRWLQKAAGVAQDGVVGPATLKAVTAFPTTQLIAAICKERINFYADLVALNPAKVKFLRGWIARALLFLPFVTP